MTTVLVIAEGGIVQDVLGADDYHVWDWDDFEANPTEYWEEYGENGRAFIRLTMHEDILRHIEELIAEDMANSLEKEEL